VHVNVLVYTRDEEAEEQFEWADFEAEGDDAIIWQIKLKVGLV
jgi:hypothetical protein